MALYPYVEGGKVEFKIVGDEYEEMSAGFEPDEGSVTRAVATCSVCGSVVDAKTTRKLFQEGKARQRMEVVVLHHPKRRGKTYRIASVEDVRIFKEAEEYLKDKREKLMLEWGMDPVPDEPLPLMSGVFNVPIYGIRTWGDLFNIRQKLTLITFTDKVRQVYVKMLAEGTKEEYIKGVVSYLAIGVERSADYNSSLSRWVSHGEFIGNTFTRQALPMVWDYFELNPSSQATGDWNSALGWILRVVDHCSFISSPANVFQSSATSLPFGDNFFDAIFTDPPYYFNVPYADLSDFFYVWLKRTIGHLYPDLFSTPLSPKTNEIVQMEHWDSERYPEKGQEWFEKMLTKSFQEIRRVLKPDGIAVIVYAHKSTEGWETLVNSLLDSGLIMTGAWPLNTEMQSRLRARESAALASSIYIVARKMQRQPTGFYNEVQEELKQHLNHKLERLWQEGIGGADFFIAAIGSAIEVFGKYEKVMDYEGTIIRADRLLEDVCRIATDYAVRQILHNGFSGEISDLTRFYVLYRWDYGEAKVQFDEARKLAQSCGIDLAVEWNRSGFISKEKEFIRVLGPQDRKLEELESSSKLIDVLHRVLLLWEKSKRSEMVSLLQESGFGRSEAFYRVAQAVSESLTLESKEKKLLDGFLAGRERLKKEVKKEHVQRRLFE